jgi:hypothetical protein
VAALKQRGLQPKYLTVFSINWRILCLALVYLN